MLLVALQATGAQLSGFSLRTFLPVVVMVTDDCCCVALLLDEDVSLLLVFQT